MRAVVQRVTEASVQVDGQVAGQIGFGLLVLIAVEKDDGDRELDLMVRKTARLRIFADEQGRMNRSVKETGGAILAISQFTLAADMKKGYRPSFGDAERPERAKALYEQYCDDLEKLEQVPVQRGVFAADMKVTLVNDGPVTIWLDFPPQTEA
ncbi:MAG: D-tyrosyl-tRNA(Tyr) deacylase [Magnetococcales bacterium]|nr:D-tyrosyl-tRNA(Tyr) deacylase [Magnetococcales bacterium]